MPNFHFFLTDTGLTLSAAAPLRQIRLPRPVTTGLTVSDALGRHYVAALADTGLTVSDSTDLDARRTQDSGLTLSESIQKTASKLLADTGLAISDSVSAIRNPRTLSDTGLTVTDSIQRPLVARTLSDDAFAAIASNTPVLDDCNRPDEGSLSDGGKWLHAGGVTSDLGLFNHAIYGTGSNSQKSFIAAGDLGDCEAWVRLVTVGINTGNYSGPVVRQNPASNTGANCYALLYIQGSGLQLYRYNGSGVGTVLATFSTVPVSGDSLGLRAVGSTLTAWYKPGAGAWQKVGTVTDTTLTHGYIGLRMDGFFHNTVTVFGGGPTTDSLSRSYARTISDTGLTVSDKISFAARPADTGLTLTESLASLRRRPVTDVGLTISDGLNIFGLIDTGVSVSTTLTSNRIRPITTTGATITDSISTHKSSRFLTDTVLTILVGLVVRKNGGNTSVSLTDRGLTIVTSLTKTTNVLRVIPNALVTPDRGCTITDGIRVTRAPPQPIPQKPHANFSWSAVALTANFTDTSDPGDAPIGSWAWSFGDGNTSSATNPTHTYASTGTYNVTLVVTTIYGQSSVRKPVSVTSSPITAGTHIDAVIF